MSKKTCFELWVEFARYGEFHKEPRILTSKLGDRPASTTAWVDDEDFIIYIEDTSLEPATERAKEISRQLVKKIKSREFLPNPIGEDVDLSNLIDPSFLS